ncbi:MAG: DUF2207 domain-containing protein [Pseudobutyrivibrio sp.]|nr:DUF2207 domain-containing protein [Pseudobutyrivibrio sp.]
MKKKLLRILSLAVVVAGLATTSATAHAFASKEDYYIKDLDVDITVNEDNTYDIEETYVYQFNEPHHGPTRDFIGNHVRIREDGTRDKMKARVSKIKVNSDDANDHIAEKSTEYKDGKSVTSIKIGSSSKEYVGERNYEISYRYTIYTPDPLKDKDELYFNIVGTMWQCYIDHVSWTIKMPKDFDESTIGYSVGVLGEAGYRQEYLTSTVDNNVIKGEYKNSLLPQEGITIRAELPEGYFKFKDNSLWGYIGFILLTILGGLAIIYKPGKRPVEVVEFYPPDDMTPVEVEMVYTGFTPSKSISLLPYLANKGFIKIHQKSKGKYEFELLNSDFSGLKKEERTFLEGMFSNAVVGTIVTEKELAKEKFYTTIAGINSYIGLKAGGQFDKKSVARMIFTFLLALVICFAVLALDLTCIGHNPMDFAFVGIIIGIVLSVVAALTSAFSNVGTWLLSLLAIAGTTALSKFALGATVVGAVLASVLTFAVGFAAARKMQRTEDNMPIYGRVLGFRNFIKTAELDKLTMLCNENPNYFFDILGFAYALGLSNVWIKRFEQLQIPVADPIWYVGAMPFNMHSFNHDFNRMMTHETAAIATSPYSNSGGSGFSGGGFSGGGSGGGGGGAW